MKWLLGAILFGLLALITTWDSVAIIRAANGGPVEMNVYVPSVHKYGHGAETLRQVPIVYALYFPAACFVLCGTCFAAYRGHQREGRSYWPTVHWIVLAVLLGVYWYWSVRLTRG